MKFAKRGALLGSTLLTSVALTAGAFAQQAQQVEQEQQQQQEVAAADRIVVTGSRIARPDFSGSAPVLSVDAAAIENSGITNLTDFLSDLPALTNSFGQQQSAGTANGGAVGLNLLNLRGLGTARTLVLVDGRRHVAGNPGTSAVDINTIPVGLIERVEVLTGGASAIYGADGVSGVVNFVMRDDFEGTRVRAQYGAGEANTAGRTFVSALHGRNFFNDRLNATLAVEFAQENDLSVDDRSFLRRGQRQQLVTNPNYAPGTGQFENIPATDLRYVDTARGGAVYTTFSTARSPFGISWVGDGSEWVHGQSTSGFFMLGGSGSLLDDFQDQVLPGQDRWLANTTLSYRFNADHRVRASAKYVHTQTQFEAQPTFDFFITVLDDVAFIPDNIRNDAIFGAVFVGRDNFDLGYQYRDVERETFRADVGFDGRLNFFGGLDYDVSYVYGRTEQNTAYINERIEERWLAAIDSVVDPVTGNIVCRSDLDPNAIPLDLDPALWGLTFTPGPNSGCVPANIFGENVSPEAAAWINTTIHGRDVIEQHVFSAYVSGSSEALFSLPAGPILFAGGVEHRRERSRSTPDALQLQSEAIGANITWNGSSAISGGEFNVTEGYVEFDVPLLAGLPLIDELTLDAAYRYSDYSTAGGTETWKFGGIWRLSDQLMLRATRARAVRAPNISELFLPQVQTFQFITDPCTAVNVNAGTEFRLPNCTANLAPFGVDPLTFVDTTSASREGRVGGNPNLNVETADTITYGFVLTPSFGPLNNLSIAVDYYDIELSDFIQQVSGQVLANRCVDLPQPNQFCDLIQRGPDGRINFFEAYLVNIAERRVRGWDISAQYLLDPQEFFGLNRDIGTFAITAAANRIQSLELREAPDAPINERVTYPEAPKWTFVSDVTWSFDRFTVNYGYTWVDEVRRQTRERMAANPAWVAPQFVNFSQRSTHDISVRYSINDNLAVSGGINNFTNQRPDLGSEEQPVGALGRYYFMGVSASF